jgi:NADPH-dependent 2,4-dienoyl-CoA reductase/sulfur reductase-like enzyme
MLPRECNLLVVGAGPAGVAAASVAAESGRDVVLLDDTPWLGGQIWRGEERTPTSELASAWLDRLGRSGTRVVTEARVIGLESPGRYLVETPVDAGTIAAKTLVLATGARELFLPFPGWTLPCVMGAGGLQALVKAGWPIEGKRVVVAGSGPLLLAVASGLTKLGARILGVFEQAPLWRLARFGAELFGHAGKLLQAWTLRRQLAGIPYQPGWWPVRAEGSAAVERLVLTNGKRFMEIDCDAVACGFGLVPGLELPVLLGCALADDAVLVDSGQQTTVPGVFAAGELTGVGGSDKALVEGQVAGYTAAAELVEAARLRRARDGWRRFVRALQHAFQLRDELRRLAEPATLVCRCEDVSYERLDQFTSWRDAKLQTRCGMGPCQGRICGAATRRLFGWGMESVRPPVLAARVGSLITAQERTDEP